MAQAASDAGVVLAGGLPEFEHLLSQLLSPEQAVISRATEVLEQMKKLSPNGCIQHLVRALRQSAHDEARSMAAVLLRRMIVKDETSLWTHLDAATHQIVKQALMSVILEEKARNIRSVIQDLISELAAGTVESGGWPELQPFLFQAVQSGQDAVVESALHVFAELARYSIVPPLDTMHQMVQSFVKHGNADIRIAAIGTACAVICNSSGGPDAREVRDKFQPMVGNILEVLSHSLNQGDEDQAQDVLEMLIEVAGEEPRFFRKQLGDTAGAMIQVAGAAQLDESTRRLATEFLVTLCEARDKAPGMMRKLPGFLEQFFAICLSFLSDLEESEEWATAEVEDDNSAGEGPLYDAGQEYTDRIALAVGGNAIAPIAARMLPQFISSQDWRQRHAGLMALAQIAEGCQKVMTAQVSQLVSLIVNAARDPHPRVRWAFCQTIGQLCTDLGPDLQVQEHARVVPAFLHLMADVQNPRVQAHATAALVNFSEDIPQEYLSPYLNSLIPQLIQLIQSGPRIVQEGALTAMASVADSVQNHFEAYYDTVVPLLSHVMQAATSKEFRLLRAKALECLSLVGMAVGKERFKQHAEGVMVLMRQLQESNLDADDPLVSYMQQAWTRICKCLGRDFIPYMAVVMPPLLEAVSQEPNIRVLGEEEEVDEDDDAEVIDLGAKRIVLSTTEMEELATSCNMVYCYVDELKDGFAPWVEATAPRMIKLLHFYFHDEVRRSAVLSVPVLLEAARDAIQKGTMPGGHGAPWLSALAHESWTAMLEALRREPETDVRVDMLQAAASILDIAGQLLPAEDPPRLVPTLQVVFDGAEERRKERLQRTAHEDFDDDEREALQEEQEMEEEALDAVQELMGSLARSLGARALPAMEPLLPTVARLMEKDRTPEETRIALCVFDDILEFSYEGGAGKYVETLAPALLAACRSPHAGLRQTAVYGLGLIAERAPEKAAALAPRVAEVCLAMMGAADGRSEDNGHATENAMSCLAKYIDTVPGAFDAATAAVALLDSLPLRVDETEARKCHARFQHMVESSNPHIVGPGSQNVPQILRAMVRTVALGTKLTEEDVLERMCFVLKHMKETLPENMLSHCAAMLSEAEREVFLWATTRRQKGEHRA